MHFTYQIRLRKPLHASAMNFIQLVPRSALLKKRCEQDWPGCLMIHCFTTTALAGYSNVFPTTINTVWMDHDACGRGAQRCRTQPMSRSVQTGRLNQKKHVGERPKVVRRSFFLQPSGRRMNFRASSKRVKSQMTTMDPAWTHRSGRPTGRGDRRTGGASGPRRG